jgi:UDP-galactopyranose mutase
MRDLICISHLRWDFVWQRPQHLLSRLARSARVLFVEEPITVEGDGQPLLEIFPGQKSSNVTVARLVQPVPAHRWIGHGDPLTTQTYCQRLLDYLARQGIERPLLWLYTPMASEFVDALSPRLLIYDVMDQLASFKGAPAELRDRERKLLERADIVFTGGVSLYRDKLAHNPDTHLLPSGVEIEHFAKAAHRDHFECPPELTALRNRPILGYFGVLDERMDFPLLAHTAAARPDWNIVLVGPIAKIDRSELPQAPNLHYIGMKPYDALPAYLAYFDVALVPFAMNEATRFLSPTKTLEYMAAHKPIVSTPINDVIELYGEVVSIGYTPDEFVSHIERALIEKSAARRAKVEELLLQHTWDGIAKHMQRLIDRKLVRDELGRVEQTKKTTAQIS